MEFRYERTLHVKQMIEPCPFCGAVEATALTEVHRYVGMERRFLIQISCRCGASGPARESVADAARAWNRSGRVADTARLAS